MPPRQFSQIAGVREPTNGIAYVQSSFLLWRDMDCISLPLKVLFVMYLYMRSEHYFCLNEEIFLADKNESNTNAANHSQKPYAIVSPNKVFTDQINASGESIAKIITKIATKASSPLGVSLICYSIHLQIHQSLHQKNF